MILKLNLAARTVDAFPSCGCAISITIVVMIQTSPLTCVVKGTAQPDGRGAQGNLTTDAFLNGSSATEKMIVVITVMSCQKTAPFVKPRLTSSARTIAAFRSNGLAILPMIVAMDLMKLKHFAKENTENVRSRNSDVITENVFQVDGDAVSLL